MVMRSLFAPLALGISLVNDNAKAIDEVVQVSLPHGQTAQVQCNKLAPGRRLTITFLEQMHGPHPDSFMNYIKSKHADDDLNGAAKVIAHLQAHGMQRAEIRRAITGCQVSNVNISPTPPPDFRTG